MLKKILFGIIIRYKELTETLVAVGGSAEGKNGTATGCLRNLTWDELSRWRMQRERINK